VRLRSEQDPLQGRRRLPLDPYAKIRKKKRKMVKKSPLSGSASTAFSSAPSTNKKDKSDGDGVSEREVRNAKILLADHVTAAFINLVHQETLVRNSIEI
jgi:hypothetical protein